MMIDTPDGLDQLDFAKGGGLMPVIVQHAMTGEVLMLGYADREAVRLTLAERQLWLYSRSRGQLWHKGATSGNLQRLVALHADCDRDTLLARVDPQGPACHTGDRSCFSAPPTLQGLADVLTERARRPPAESYTARLYADRNLRLKKLGEEAGELAVACADNDADGATEEGADLLYHLLVACAAVGVELPDLLQALDRRRG